MTYLPGQDEAIFPGTNHITAAPVIEEGRHLVVLDLSPVAYPLDGFIPTLLFAIERAGLWDAATAMVRNKISASIQHKCLDALESEPSIARTMQFTLTPDDADRIALDLQDAAVAPDACRFPGCNWLRVDADWCTAHLMDGVA